MITKSLTRFALSVSLLVLSAAAWGQAGAEPLYPDVPADHWARAALEELAGKYGLQLGFPDGRFQGQQALTRYEMAALIRRLVALDSLSAPDQAALDALKTAFAKELADLAERTDAELQEIYDRLDLIETAQVEQQADMLDFLKRQLPFRLSGDVAFRYEHVATELLNPATSISSTPQTRFTLSLDSLQDQPFVYGARLSVGNLRNAGNPWWRLGDFFARVELGLDRFFVSWRPSDNLDLTFGKFQNLYSHSELLLDRDIQPEGAFQRLHFQNLTPWWESASLVLGETIVNMNSLYQGNVFMLSGKGDTRFRLAPNLHLDLGLGYHHWLQEAALYSANSIAQQNGQEARVLGNRQTNTPGTEFGILNGFGALSWDITPDLPLTLSADYLNNLRASSMGQALQAGLSLGALRAPGDWQLAYLLKYLEKDASVAYFVEDQLGGTDLMAHEGQLSLKVWERTTLFGTYQYANSLSASDSVRHTLRVGLHQAF
ncbi:MAG: putative porin [Candidatus Sericytochromatia bacterium]